ncbi:uncharacterized protein LOC141614800 [Silene latifolia]|uniref:uncharacterized protein LOC141614800 n=1 Tax=Silene latifolia TaxID=37657 RepID=UPI003D774CD1
MVFKNLAMLIETHFGGGFCWYPFPIFDNLSQFSKLLCKLSLELNGTIFRMDLVIPDGAVPAFPNVKHFTCTIGCYHNSCILSMKCFIDACPMLEEFKLQICFLDKLQGFEEASELQEIDLENEKENEETNSSEKPSHPNLRIMELVGFLGTRCDVQLALAVVSYASSLETIICDPEGKRFTLSDTTFWTDFSEEFEVAKRRACKLAKIVAPKVNVVIT